MTALPINEILWLTCDTGDGRSFQITSNKDRSMYYIYSVINGVYRKLGKDTNAGNLDRKYINL